MSILALGLRILPSPALATYVEGLVEQDTIWTLTDSPFVLTNDIRISPNVTLTIEPGVEVRFGGNFSIIVEGDMRAIGTKSRNITFTSNKIPRKPGDWESLRYRFSKNSFLEYASVEYSTHGIDAESSNITIRNCYIVENSEDGILVVNSTVEANNNVIAKNLEDGIHLTGNNEATVENNTIKLNTRGILLDGDEVSDVSLLRNILYENTQSGLHLDANAYNNIAIFDNFFSGNLKGIHVSGETGTTVTNNSISLNTIGVFYETAQNHQIHFCDIYGNEIGVEVSAGVTVDATYNYWGESSGPRHVSLNPEGKGNRVEADESSIDFIFFLTYPISYINQRPTAQLLTDKTLVNPNQTVAFIGSNSFDDGRVEEFFFDFGDGLNSGWTTLSILTHQYMSIGTYNATLIVRDDFGATSSNEAIMTIDIRNLMPLSVQLTANHATTTAGEQIFISIYVSDGSIPVENADVIVFPVKDGSFDPSAGTTNATGHFITVFTAPEVPRSTNVRMIATASEAGYADGSTYEYLEVLPPLSILVSSEPEIVRSEETVRIKAHILYDGNPVGDAFVEASSDDGILHSFIEVTDTNGDVEFGYTAPQTLATTYVNLSLSADKDGYQRGSMQATLTIEPKNLDVRVIAESQTLFSGEISVVRVIVEYDTYPTSGASVAISTDYEGSLYPLNQTSNANGTCSFTLTTPQVQTPRNMTVIATGEKLGFVAGSGQTQIGVEPKMLSSKVTVNPVAVESGIISTINVYLESNGNPVEGVEVTVSSNGEGYFSENKTSSDESGNCTFIFTAPQTSTESSITITAISSKAGYAISEAQEELIVFPSTSGPGEGGLPLMTILLLAIPIAVVCIVLVLIKLKIITIKSDDE
ncbi:MAG: right-handed parallel beta-helix repeat-containing protein [Candidatus Bathyarchaeota archaeon]|nr:right-handed parallel beta-helix repeat-containing protein [Candidatus Bathyarchaeota archaeon]